MSTFSMSLMSAEGSPCSTTTRCRLLCREPSCRFCRARRGFGAVRSGDVNGLERREACLDEKFHFALVAESGDHAAVSCEIESREEQTAAFDEFAFELELLLKEPQVSRRGWRADYKNLKIIL